MKKEKDDNIYITKSTLKKQGWTENLIKSFLKPAKTVVNPIYHNASPMLLYLEKDVESVIVTEEFKIAKEKSEKRKQSASKAIETKKSKTKSDIEKLLSNIKPPKREDYMILRKKAIKHYNEHKLNNTEDWNFEIIDSNDNLDFSFERRIICNYLRHVVMKFYENNLEAMFGRVGNETYYEQLKTEIMNAIFKTYPELQYDWKEYYKNNQLNGV